MCDTINNVNKQQLLYRDCKRLIKMHEYYVKKISCNNYV